MRINDKELVDKRDATCLRRHPCHIGAISPHLARGRLFQTGQKLDQCAFPGICGAKKNVEVPWFQLQGGLVDMSLATD